MHFAFAQNSAARGVIADRCTQGSRSGLDRKVRCITHYRRTGPRSVWKVNYQEIMPDHPEERTPFRTPQGLCWRVCLI